MKNKKKKVLVVVAHPDDEVIWMGGALLRNKNNWDITIISLCRKNDKDREPRFRKVSKILGSNSFINDIDDEKLMPIEIKKIIKVLKKYADRNYDYIFTHGKNGEYGHIRHKEVHKSVKLMVKERAIQAKKIFFFSYLRNGDYCSFNKNAEKFIKLNDNELSMKKYLIKEIYGFKKGGFEEKSCGKIEAFNLN